MKLLLSPVLPPLSLSFLSLLPFQLPAMVLFNNQNIKALIQQALTCMSNLPVPNSGTLKEQADAWSAALKKKNLV